MVHLVAFVRIDVLERGGLYIGIFSPSPVTVASNDVWGGVLHPKMAHGESTNPPP